METGVLARGGPSQTSLPCIKEEKQDKKKLHTQVVIHEESEEDTDTIKPLELGIPLIRRKLSTCDRTAPVNGRKSVDLRRSNLNLYAQEERMPSTVSNLLNHQRRSSNFKRQSVLATLDRAYMENSMKSNQASNLASIPDNFALPRKSVQVQRQSVFSVASNQEEPQKMQNLINRRLTMEMKTPMNKIETKRIQVYKYLFTGCIILGLLTAAGSVATILASNETTSILNPILALFNVIPSIFVLIVPRLLFSKQHMNKIGKLMRLQNLRNAFLLKEVQEINDGMRNNGWNVQ